MGVFPFHNAAWLGLRLGESWLFVIGYLVTGSWELETVKGGSVGGGATL
jgi:hypothetical protein